MIKNSKTLLLCLFISLLCLDLIQSQTLTPTPTQALTPIQTPVQTVNPKNTPNAVVPNAQPVSAPLVSPAPGSAVLVNPAGGDQGKPQAAGKYTEHLSVCRENEFDETQLLSDEKKKQRIELLEKKISNENNNKSDKDKINIIATKLLIFEHIKNKNIDIAQKIFLSNSEAFEKEDAVLIQAEFLIAKKSLIIAAELLENFLKEKPTARKILLQLAQIRKNQKLYDDAKNIYLSLEKIEKNKYSLELCEVLTMDSYYKDAEYYCLKAAEKNKKDPLPEIFLGISFRERQDLKQAQAYFESSVIKRKTEFAYSCLGEIAYMQKNYTESIKFYELSSMQNPKSTRALWGLGNAYFEEKKYDKALVHFNEACLQNKSKIEYIYNARQKLKDLKSDLALKYLDVIQKCNSN